MHRIVGLAVVAVAVVAPSAHASCAMVSAEQQLADADVVFVGTAVREVRPAIMRFRVERYVKGSGPARLDVSVGPGGGRPQKGGAVVRSSVDIDPRRGERWHIFARRVTSGLETDACAGSSLLEGGATPAEVAGRVLAWLVGMLA